MRFWNLLACSTAVLAALTPRDDDDSGLNLVFEGCSSKEVKVYKKAIVEAKECIDAIVQLRSGSDTAFDQDQFPHELEYRDRYFGSASDEDSELVTSNFISMSDNIDQSTYHCGTNKDGNDRIIGECWGTSSGNEMTTCPHFFKLNDAAKVYLVIHELSHAEYNGGSLDLEYHERPVQQLAINSPEMAAHNADSYGLYAQRVCADKKGKIVPTCEDDSKYC